MDKEVLEENNTNELTDQLAFSLKEACKITGLSRTTLWKAIRNRKLACYKVGRRVLVSRQHIQDYLAIHELPNQRSTSPLRSKEPRSQYGPQIIQ